ncbi:MAG: UDP-glucose 4-epimerase [Chlamydiales bacterium]|jgi:UDP-glucose 4-epimerase
MSTYLVTGGAGFIGSHITTALVERGDRVRILDDMSSGQLENLAHLDVGEVGSGRAVEFLRGNIVVPGDCATACEGVRGVFHEAAQVSVPESVANPEKSLEVNVLGTMRLLEAARMAGVEQVVFAASAAAYGNAEKSPKVEDFLPMPLSPYAVGKVAGEHLLRAWGENHGLRTVALRYFNIFGPRQLDDSPYTGVIAIFAKALLEGRVPMIYGDGEQTRDFTFVGNAVQANLKAMQADLPAGTVINIGGGASISLNSLLSTMAEICGVSVSPNFGPVREGDVRHSVASLERARSVLGYEPTVDWRAGLKVTLEWYRERHQTAGQTG